MKIGEISTLNPNLSFRNDIQLSHYRSPENAQMLASYQFSSRGVGQNKSTVELLELLCRAVVERSENRFLFQATYGKGKSHFALALANFFGKAAASPEVGTILNTVAHVSNDAARVGSLRSFKENHRPFLVLMIDGVGASSLRDKVFRALGEALLDHDATADLTPPFWFGEARKFLDRITPDEERRAEDFLASHRLDLGSLKRSVENREGRYYELCHELFKHLYGARPNFGSETSLKDALKWAEAELCGAEGPFSGLLVLFDEFSVFVQDYGQQRGGALQDLLNGVEQSAGRVLFVAFSQQEPERWVRDDGSADVQSLYKELNRLPLNNRYSVQSSLEDVIKGYFKEDEGRWRDFLGSGIGGQVSHASDVAFEAFKAYYQRSLGWSSDRFQESITKDCFPLHPLTTVLLSSLQFEQAATTRSVIGFLTDDEGDVKRKLGEEAVVDGQVNWILPVALVDYFEDMLGEQVWNQYQGVRAPDLSDVQSAVLKAMVLQRIAEISTKGFGPQGFETVIGQLAGISTGESKAALESLEQARYIRYDSQNRSYSFWVGSNGAVELERLVNKKMDELRLQRDMQARNKLTGAVDDLIGGKNRATDLLLKDDIIGSFPVSVKWGHPEDWAADEIILSRAGLTQRNLEHLLGSCRASTTDYAERRGAVILLLAETQGDIDFYERELETILDATADLKAAPFVVMQPRTPNPELSKMLLKYTVLSDGVFANAVVPELGRQVFDEEKKRVEGQLEAGFSKLRTDARLVTTQDARGRVRAVASMGNTARRLELTLKELFTIIYYNAPESFFDQYKHSSNANLRTAVMALVPVLEDNNVVNAVLTSKVANEVRDKFLAGSWGVLTRQQQLQVPTAPKIKAAWDYLDKAFPDKVVVPIGKVLTPLLNAPYGYDYNTLSLLFASWFGFAKLDLEIFKNQSSKSLAELVKSGKGRADGFIDELGSSFLRRRGKVQVDVVEAAINRVERGGLDRTQADKDASLIQNFLERHQADRSPLSNNAAAARQKVTTALTRLTEYDTLVAGIANGLERAKTTSDFAGQLKQIDRLPELFTVRSELPSPEVIRGDVLSKLQAFSQNECEKNEKLGDLTDYSMQANNLKQLKTELARLNLDALETRVTEALERLEEAKAQLKAESDAKGRVQLELNVVQQLQAKDVGLAQLLENKKKLGSYESFGVESVVEAAHLKLAQVQESIDRLRAFSGPLSKRVESVKTSREARDLGEEILRKRGLYENTSDLSYLDEDRKRLRLLEDYFTQLEQPIRPKSPAEVTELISQLTSLQQKFSEDGALSATQLEQAQARSHEVVAFASGQRAEAQGWLESVVADLAAGRNLKALRNQLASPHSFLAGDLYPQLEALAEQVDVALSGEAQTSGQLEAIKQLPVRGTLVQLQENLTRLNAYKTAPHDVQTAANAKSGALTKEIARLTGQLPVWQEKLARTTQPKDVERLIGEVQRAEELYTGSELEGEVGVLLTQLETFAGVLRELATPPPTITATFIETRQRLLDAQSTLTESLPAATGDPLRGLIEKERRALAERLTQEEERLAETADKLVSAQTGRAVENLDARLKTLLTFFNGSERGAALNPVVERFVALGQYFKDLGRIEAAPNMTPADLSAQQRGVDEVCNRHKEFLGDAQRDAARVQLDRIESAFRSKREAAEGWLAGHREALSRAVTASDLNRLERKLQDVPAFLPDELRGEHAEAQRQVAAKLGGLELEVIEDRFKNLAAGQRTVCLQRLQALMRELEAV